MASYLLPDGGEIVAGRGWSGRRAAALHNRATFKDAYTRNALRGAHITVERIKYHLAHSAMTKVERDQQEAALLDAEIAFEAAHKAHVAFEQGEELSADPSDDESQEDESAEGEDDKTPSGKATPGPYAKKRKVAAQ